MFSLSIFYLTKLCNVLLIFFWLDQDNKELKEWWWPDELIFFFYVIRCCRGAVHYHAKLTKEDDYYNTMKVILCSILSGAPNENIIQNHLNIALLNVF